MINAHPFKCDVCGAPKGATNHWWLGYRHSYPVHGGVCVVLWTDAAAKLENVAHLCGIECVNKWSGRELAALAARPEKED